MPPPNNALFPKIAVSVTVSVPSLEMPPPSESLFPEIVQSITVSVPPLEMPPAAPSAMARPDRTVLFPVVKMALLMFVPLMVTSCVNVAPLPVVGPKFAYSRERSMSSPHSPT